MFSFDWIGTISNELFFMPSTSNLTLAFAKQILRLYIPCFNENSCCQRLHIYWSDKISVKGKCMELATILPTFFNSPYAHFTYFSIFGAIKYYNLRSTYSLNSAMRETRFFILLPCAKVCTGSVTNKYALLSALHISKRNNHSIETEVVKKCVFYISIQ